MRLKKQYTYTQKNKMEISILSNVRKRKPNSLLEPCPICGLTLRSAEIESHFVAEMEKLQKIGISSGQRNPTSTRTSVSPVASSSKVEIHSTSNQQDTEIKLSEDCWTTFQKIKSNRQNRLKIKPKKRKLDEKSVSCPVCNEKTNEDLSIHVDKCLKRSENKLNGLDSDDESIDVEGEAFEEYEWAGQTRIRASSMLPGGYANAGVGTTITQSTPSDDENELNVDGDDTQIYGPPQFSERSIVPISNESNSYLRELVIGNEPPSIQNEELKEGSSSAASEHEEISQFMEAPEPLSAMPVVQDSNHIIESLKAKIREYERYIQNKPKCLICLSDFKKPVVSICCWHVYCQECWLNSLGSRKLCPQCSMITSATDLRRIYL